MDNNGKVYLYSNIIYKGVVRMEEKIIRFLIDKFNNDNKDNSNIVAVCRSDVGTIGLSEGDIIKYLYVLQEDGYIVIKEKSVNNDLSRYWEVALKSPCLHYFDGSSLKNNRVTVKELKHKGELPHRNTF